jgi:hypothetical protein
LVKDREKISILYREPSIDASYQVAIHLGKRFQRRRFLEIDQLETRIACGETVWPNEPKLGRSIYGKSCVAIGHFVPIR